MGLCMLIYKRSYACMAKKFVKNKQEVINKWEKDWIIKNYDIVLCNTRN